MLYSDSLILVKVQAKVQVTVATPQFTNIALQVKFCIKLYYLNIYTWVKYNVIIKYKPSQSYFVII